MDTTDLEIEEEVAKPTFTRIEIHDEDESNDSNNSMPGLEPANNDDMPDLEPANQNKDYHVFDPTLGVISKKTLDGLNRK